MKVERKNTQNKKTDKTENFTYQMVNRLLRANFFGKKRSQSQPKKKEYIKTQK